MKRRWKLLRAIGVIALAGAIAPILYVESQCRQPLPGFDPAASRTALLPEADRRAEARTWLTYPEWHIVYSADSLGRHLRAQPPSSYAYWSDVRGFWTSYCLLNRATRGSPGAGDAKVMIYTIGISFSFEMAIKALYEKTIGWAFERIGGWTSVDDLYAAKVQQIYGGFMHQTPWYRFPFGRAFNNLWGLDAHHSHIRHWERRFALSAEYGVKAGYAKLIGAASGATLGRDQLTLRFVAQASPAAIHAIDRRLKPVGPAGTGRTIVEAPRYAVFTDLLGKMADRQVKLVEIAGNDDIFVTFLVPDKVMAKPPKGIKLLSLPLGDRPGWQRIGLSTKVPALLPLIQSVEARGGRLEHVYDY